MKITQEHLHLFKFATQQSSTDNLVTNVLRLKAECKTHKQIASILGISASYVNHIITTVRKQFMLDN